MHIFKIEQRRGRSLDKPSDARTEWLGGCSNRMQRHRDRASVIVSNHWCAHDAHGGAVHRCAVHVTRAHRVGCVHFGNGRDVHVAEIGMLRFWRILL